MVIPSPCIGFCRIDERSGLCGGCARTRQEVAVWQTTPDAVRERIWAELPGRRAELGIGLHRLGWTQAEIRSFVAGTLRAGGGTWVAGAYGAVAEFCIGPDEAFDCDPSTTTLLAVTSRGAVRLEIADQVRALALATTVGSARMEVIILAVPRAQLGRPAPAGLSALGKDREAIRAGERGEVLYDLGLGRSTAGFCIRTPDAGLARELDAHAGQQWPVFLAAMGGRILQASPTRVVRCPVGRIEVFTPIPPPGGQSPAGPHTHFLPAHLAAGRETPPGLELPDALAPCAIFYPEVGPTDPCA